HRGHPRPIAAINPLPPAVERVLRTAMAEAPSERHATADQFAHELAAVTGATPSSGVATREWRSLRPSARIAGRLAPGTAAVGGGGRAACRAAPHAGAR